MRARTYALGGARSLRVTRACAVPSNAHARQGYGGDGHQRYVWRYVPACHAPSPVRLTCPRCSQFTRTRSTHRDALLAVLDAFVHDPLINWRLVEDATAESVLRSSLVVPDEPHTLPTLSSTLRSRSAVAGDYARANARALAVIGRVERKVSGRDFGDAELSVPQQVERLIAQATSAENLAQGYIDGWCPFY